MERPMRSLSLPVALVAVFVSSVALAVEPGQPAPDFMLKDLDGKPMRLSDQKGKIVVLEWFNPECPFVKASHTKGSLVGTAKKYTSQGVVWWAINSSAPGKQGNGADKNRVAQKTFGMEHPILVDESGQVGHLYGATNTPNLFVIDANGKLAYRGAIDNSPDGEKGSPQGGTLVNYVDQAVGDLKSGKAVETAATKPYGCSVKYGG
jgi:peroxiredoxin